MKIISLMVITFFLSSYTPPHKQDGIAGVHFIEGGWFEAANAARKEGKPIFAFVWGPNCLESTRMLEDIFPDSDVAEFFNENFINYKINGNDLKNNMRVSNWGVTSLPSFIFLTPRRKVVLMKKGFHKNEDLIKIAKIALKKM